MKAIGMLKTAGLAALLMSTPAKAGVWFDKTWEAFQSASPVERTEFTTDTAWTGYCFSATDNYESQGLLAVKPRIDPLLGDVVASYVLAPTDRFDFTRFNSVQIRAIVRNVRSEDWSLASRPSSDLNLRDYNVYLADVLRKVNDAEHPYYVMAKQLCSGATDQCATYGGVGRANVACYFYVKKY